MANPMHPDAVLLITDRNEANRMVNELQIFQTKDNNQA